MISKREDGGATAGIDVQPGGLVMGVGLDPLPKPLNDVMPPPTEDTATRLAHVAKNENTWEGARAALLRAMRLTREWERDERERDHQRIPHGER